MPEVCPVGRLRGCSPPFRAIHPIERTLRCFEEAGATWAACSTDETEAEALFAARRLAYPALERLGPVLTEDVCVPKGQVPRRLERIERTAERRRITIANIAHAGDGNLHPLIITDPGDEEARVRAQAAFDDIIADALALGGTVTGEHGVGLLKRPGLAAELPPPPCSPCTAPSRTHSTPPESSTPARSSDLTARSLEWGSP